MSDETPEVNWHSLDDDEVLKRLESSKEGLSEDEAKQRIEKTGLNSLEVEEGISSLRLLARQVHNPLIYLLAGAAVLSLFVGHRVDAAVIAGVIVLNSLLGFFQEWRAEGALEALREMAAPHARVLRAGKPADIEADHIVPGDILRLDESALTGESQPVAKDPEKVDEDTSMADRKNMVWMSTSVTGGRGWEC